jgi:hypothetical protein
MKHPCTKHSLILVAVVSLLFISAVSASVQTPPPPPHVPPPERVLAPRPLTLESLRWENERRMRGENEHNNTNIIGFDDPLARRQAARMMIVAQVKKDTERIQFFNTEMMRSVASNAPLDYDGIIKATGEIKNRVVRLMLNLDLPKLEKSEMPQAGPELFDRPALVASLKKLDELVKYFGANPLPLPGKVSVIDVKAVTDARQNMADIIVLSDTIRKSAKRLRQTARQ